jgi:hypothetical protein
VKALKYIICIFMTITFLGLIFSGCATSNNTTILNGADSNAEGKRLVTLRSNNGITQKFILVVPKNPVGIVILFPGSDGRLKISNLFGSPTINGLDANFLVRTYKRFARHNFIVAMVDCPNELYKPHGLTYILRGGPQHQWGVSATIDYCKQIANVPIWLIGTSAGTISVANLGISLRNKVDGLVFTSSVTDMTRNEFMSHFKNGIIDYALFMIEDPVFIAAHARDACAGTPPGKAQMLKARLVNSSEVVVKIYNGGHPVGSDICGGRHYHGFYGMEGTVINDIAQFIKAHLPPVSIKLQENN